MVKIDETKFLADYKLAKEEKLDIEINKTNAISVENQKINELNFSDHIKEVLFKEVIAEKEAEFNLENAENKIANFEKYLVEVEQEENQDQEEQENKEE